MEKQLKLKNKILKALVTFHNPPFSPGRDNKSRPENTTKWVRPHHGVKGFSCPMVSMIPDEARRKSHDNRSNSIDEICYQEPTSPKISCMGQIKHKKKHIKKGKAKDIEVKKHVSTFQKMLFFHAAKPKSPGRKSDASVPHCKKDALADNAPHVSQMRRFSSGREALANFDWRVAHNVAPEEDEIDYYSDEERTGSDSEDEQEVKIPFSAPILVGATGHGDVLNLKPRKEINLWKRRTMAPPRPLQLNH
ncbi:hypothetical protein RJT34_08828 [Clitoria ternatea]|uniref:Syringolide-induced protein 14-1-1 n=1 Tax=Clitoria ternatea TaxID=43366 RepID=A0AAN9K551_CLITE